MRNLPLTLTVCTVVKSKVNISENVMAFSEYMSFKEIALLASTSDLKLYKEIMPDADAKATLKYHRVATPTPAR